MIDWQPLDEPPPNQEPVLVTSEHFPGWYDIGAAVLGEWRRGLIAGDLMQHYPTHWARLTRAEPWTPEKSRRAVHPGAQEVGEQESGWPGGDIVTYECPFCKHRWQKELPQ